MSLNDIFSYNVIPKSYLIDEIYYLEEVMEKILLKLETAQENELPLLFAGEDENAFDQLVKKKNTKFIERFLKLMIR